jgi:hypothetical protein
VTLVGCAARLRPTEDDEDAPRSKRPPIDDDDLRD